MAFALLQLMTSEIALGERKRVAVTTLNSLAARQDRRPLKADVQMALSQGKALTGLKVPPWTIFSLFFRTAS